MILKFIDDSSECEKLREFEKFQEFQVYHEFAIIIPFFFPFHFSPSCPHLGAEFKGGRILAIPLISHSFEIEMLFIEKEF